MLPITQKLLAWFDIEGRKHLPWQQDPTPYRVWVSEIMLQQTQVSTVIPYFERFMKCFPTLSSLSKAPLEAVLREWTGLGYYARARNLHQTAQIISGKYQGQFPLKFEKVLELPGIGRSTAGAILALSQQQRHPILDGNVKRVLTRVFAIEGWTGDKLVEQTLWTLSDQLTPRERVHHYTQAIMDLGATVCTRSNPNCQACPLNQDCQAYRQNIVQYFPASKPKAAKPTQSVILLMLVQKDKKILLEKRPSKGIWGGLWSFPECQNLAQVSKLCRSKLNLTIKSKMPLTAFRHTFTHFHLDIQPVVCHITTTGQGPLSKLSAGKDPNYCWHPLGKPLKLGVAAPIKRLLEQIK